MKWRTAQATAGVLGAGMTLLLHLLFFAVAIWDGSVFPRFPDRPDAVGAGANRGKPEGDSTERRMIVRLMSDVGSLPSPRNHSPHLSELVRAALKTEITGPDILPLPPIMYMSDGVPAESTDAELMARAKMMGTYESQIRARIERAWSLPAGIPWGRDFSCQALIRQHRDGRVSEVELAYDGCEDSVLRQSLIKAIFAASPLPAPPHPAVFVDNFHLVFRSGVTRPE